MSSSLRWLARIERRLDALGLWLTGPLAWPCLLALLGACTLAISWLVVPGSGEEVTLFGRPPSPPCPVLLETGQPCGQCGMTRAFVWAARGDWPLAFRYNPSGLLLWIGLVSGGVIGSIRLAKRDPSLLRISWPLLGTLAAGWLAVYGGGYALRAHGYHPMPHHDSLHAGTQRGQ